jgi:hypothetical protein
MVLGHPYFRAKKAQRGHRICTIPRMGNGDISDLLGRGEAFQPGEAARGVDRAQVVPSQRKIPSVAIIYIVLLAHPSLHPSPSLTAPDGSAGAEPRLFVDARRQTRVPQGALRHQHQWQRYRVHFQALHHFYQRKGRTTSQNSILALAYTLSVFPSACLSLCSK